MKKTDVQEAPEGKAKRVGCVAGKKGFYPVILR